MGRNLVECLARFGPATCDYSASSVELWQKFGIIFAVLNSLHFALTAHLNLKSLYCSHCNVLSISYQLVANLLVSLELTCITLQIRS